MYKSSKCKMCAALSISDRVVKKAVCSKCKIAYDRKRYLKKQKEIIAKNAVYRRTERGREVNRRASLKYGRNGRRAELLKQYMERLKRKPELYEEYLFRHRANGKVAYAVKTGRLKKGVCESCGSVKVEAHHDDYQKPLEVRWFCKPCHGKTRSLTEV